MADKTLKSALDCDHECTTPMALMPVHSKTFDPQDAELQMFLKAVQNFVCSGISQIPDEERVHNTSILARIARPANVSTNGNTK